ncbi:hypothetical protein WMY93_002298 [Mugilogobius chulae]|uniref:Uncharacterized protein n=1 Tax=Mugilogobius chulae TaxID=88201 RepID=A0AAW0PWT0_9GOBI
MKRSLVLLLLGTLFGVGTDQSFTPPSPCSAYVNVSQVWRNYGFKDSKYFASLPYSDSYMTFQFTRFVGFGGDELSILCKPSGTGSTYSASVVNSEIPRTFYVDVVHCPEGFYIYKPRSNPDPFAGYVTLHSACTPGCCGPHAECYLKTVTGAGACRCLPGFEMELKKQPPDDVLCFDINECEENADVCGPNSECTNNDGGYNCSCSTGYEPTDQTVPVSPANLCTDTDECLDSSVCGPDAVCNNNIGSYTCTCEVGYTATDSAQEPSPSNICTDINECVEEPTVCGPNGGCFNTKGSFYCVCFSGYRVDPTLTGISDPCFDCCKLFDGMYGKEVAGVGPYVVPPKVGRAGNGKTGTIILDLSERLIEGLLENGKLRINKTMNITTSTFDLALAMFSPEDYHPKSFSLTAGGISMEINIEEVAKNNNGSASVAFMMIDGLDSLLSHHYFQSENITQFASGVFRRFSHNEQHQLHRPGQLHHSTPTGYLKPKIMICRYAWIKRMAQMLSNDTLPSCVYWVVEEMMWEDASGKEEVSASGFWSEEGCWVSYSNENYTVCSCSHLSTFALIMQIGEPPPQSHFLDWLNRICVIVGLFFFTLAILTFLLCSWNPKINNTARLHLCLNLGLSHLLLLFNENYYADQPHSHPTHMKLTKLTAAC